MVVGAGYRLLCAVWAGFVLTLLGLAVFGLTVFRAPPLARSGDGARRETSEVPLDC